MTQKPWADFDHCRVTVFTWFSRCTQNAKDWTSPVPELMGALHEDGRFSMNALGNTGLWKVRDHLSVPSSPLRVTMSCMSTWLRPLSFSFVVSFVPTFHRVMWALERHTGFTDMVEVRQQDIAVWKRDAKSPYRFKFTHCSWKAIL